MMLPSVVVIGPGRIGRDLIIKLIRSKRLRVTALIGRNYGTRSEEFARDRQIPYYGAGLEGYLKEANDTSIFIDATSADFHSLHVSRLKPYNPFIIDLTPSGLGSIYSPLASPQLPEKGKSTSLVSCVESVKVMININPANPPVTMKTTLSLVGSTRATLPEIREVAERAKLDVQKYCPGYSFQVPPLFMQDGRLVTMLRVSGAGDYLPDYAGNLDIINCACLEICERISNTHYT